jgi:hypothetical protein
MHGVAKPRGLDFVPRSSSYDGRFGRLFRKLAPCESYDDPTLAQLAATMRDQAASGGWNSATPVLDGDNAAIPAGYTYLGQFIDHDLTFDPVSSLTRLNDPDALQNFRTPRFDMDSVYGSGPRDEPFQYELRSHPARLLLGSNAQGEVDLPRNQQEVALTGDPRNDENKILSQLHTVFIRLHNRILQQVQQTEVALTPEQQFERAQQLTRWHYQWVMVEDFLRRICDEEVYSEVWTRDTKGKGHNATLRHYLAREHAYMPVEFSVAAFRFGHSMIRPTYALNATLPAIPLFVPGEPGPTGDLRGGNVLPGGWAVDWTLFFDTAPGTAVQPSRLINTKIDPALFELPHNDGTDDTRNLAFRNLKRGQSLQLPSGQAVAKLLKADVIDPATASGGILSGETPLWFYLLKEAELQHEGVRLGTCGSTIVAETLLGLLETDKFSFMKTDDAWVPDAVASGGSYTMADLVKHALDA